MSIDIGLLVLRALIGFILFAHATQKLAGWFSGPGLDRAALIFESLGQVPGRPMAVLASICESAAAVLLILGLGTPLGAAIATGTMLVAGVAMTAKAGKSWNAGGGGEYPLVLAGLAASIGFTGAGSWSADAILHLPWDRATGSEAALIGLGAAVLGVLASLGPIARMLPARRSANAGAPR
ncbi:putative oxidoreductase [Micromonospora rhizosphaerae]|uniref:Putative oxidoreductase n=1 Tax=Micromonospora rhizosphaerae TaxID=568872 RepID=A0A1C6SD88_9ACTN|nr:DoxX family protein [Micromonospora rhizosphaerae]SCL27335.1 putative oxidoreductase [Micromonospora rhizosphaerae]